MNGVPHESVFSRPIQEAQPQIPGRHTAEPATIAPTLIANVIAGFFKSIGLGCESVDSIISKSYSEGSSAVNGEQQGFSVAWKFITSVRMPSGSYRLS